jgi:DNA repair exonuclease SbcCD nuclease subunit
VFARFRFVHAADLHLDTPFEGIGRASPEVAARLREASLEAWDGLVALAIEREAAFVLVAGDIYDGADRGVRAQLRFHRGLERLAAGGVRVFIVHGNHDPLDGWSAIRSWPEGVTVFGCDRVESVPVTKGPATIATVHGISYPRRDVRENLALGFSRGGAPGFNIGLLHCNAGANPRHAPYSACTVDDLRQAGLDYWALGHVHEHDVLARDPLVVYPGTLQGRSSHAFDLGPKGALLVQVGSHGVEDLELVALDRVRFVGGEVDVASAEDLPALERALLAWRDRVRDLNAGRGLILRAVLAGRGPVRAHLDRHGVLRDLVQALREREEGVQPFVWWDAIADRSSAARDLDAVAAREDFPAELLRAGRRLREQPDALASAVEGQREALVRAGAHRWLGEIDPDERLALLDAATVTALDLVSDD